MRNKSIRRFKCNNYIKGRIQSEFPHFINNGAISIMQKDINKCVILINENRIGKMDLKYIYTTLISESREF